MQPCVPTTQTYSANYTINHYAIDLGSGPGGADCSTYPTVCTGALDGVTCRQPGTGPSSVCLNGAFRRELGDLFYQCSQNGWQLLGESYLDCVP